VGIRSFGSAVDSDPLYWHWDVVGARAAVEAAAMPDDDDDDDDVVVVDDADDVEADMHHRIVPELVVTVAPSVQ